MSIEGPYILIGLYGRYIYVGGVVYLDRYIYVGGVVYLDRYIHVYVGGGGRISCSVYMYM